MMAAVLNGQLPATLLATVPWDTAERLRPGALADLLRLNAAFRARFGHNLIINESYRDLPTQQAYYKNPPSGAGTAAWPGTSNHGWGLAVDLQLTAAEYAWMRANALRYGWVNPVWAHDGRGVEEPWHWEHTTAWSVVPDVITPQPVPVPEEDIMATLAELDAVIAARTQPKLRRLKDGGRAVWMDLGTCRRHLTAEQAGGVDMSRVVEVSAADAFWDLPIIGRPGELFAHAGDATGAAFLLAARGIRHIPRPEFEAWLEPLIVVLPVGHAVWSLPVLP